MEDYNQRIDDEVSGTENLEKRDDLWVMEEADKVEFTEWKNIKKAFFKVPYSVQKEVSKACKAINKAS